MGYGFWTSVFGFDTPTEVTSLDGLIVRLFKDGLLTHCPLSLHGISSSSTCRRRKICTCMEELILQVRFLDPFHHVTFLFVLSQGSGSVGSSDRRIQLSRRRMLFAPSALLSTETRLSRRVSFI